MKEFIKNICVAFTAQGISLIASVILSLILPKFLSIEEYGYWQLFIFYIGYKMNLMCSITQENNWC